MKTRNLMKGSYMVSLFISTVTIILVQAVSLLIVLSLMIRDINHKAETTADEMSTLLAVPMYNVDDEQTLRIAGSLISTGRLSGIRIKSTASGVIVDDWTKQSSPWIKPQTRKILYEGIDLGELTILYGNSDFVGFLNFFSLLTLILFCAVLSANYAGSRLLIHRRMEKTFAVLVTGINQIAGGRIDYDIPETGYADMDLIVSAMNDMSRKIIAKNRELKEINDSLESRVAERTSELETSLVEQRLMQERLIESGKLSVLGQLSAGIAHEFNTPLGAIISAEGMLTEFFDTKLITHYNFLKTLNQKERDLFDLIILRGLEVNKNLYLPEYSRKELKETARLLESAQIANSEAIAEFLLDMGLAGVLHELIPLLRTERSLEIVSAAADPVIARRMSEIIGESGKKASGVISALRSYLSSDSGAEPQPVNIDGDLRRVLTLMHNLLKAGITVKTELDKVYVMGFSDQLSLVWMNLIRNGIQAMNYHGVLTLKTFAAEDKVRVQIADTGSGIPEEIVGHIFDPFFTTREHGEGMGLGLDICKKIVENHEGVFEVESRPGKTVFTVILPELHLD